MKIVGDGWTYRLIPDEGETQEDICLAVAVVASRFAVGPARLFPSVKPPSQDRNDYRQYLTQREHGTGLRIEYHQEFCFEVHVYPQSDGSLWFNEMAYHNRTGNEGIGVLIEANKRLQRWKQEAA